MISTRIVGAKAMICCEATNRCIPHKILYRADLAVRSTQPACAVVDVMLENENSLNVTLASDFRPVSMYA